jgi:predicted RNA-binding Zn ribbon-like protein
MESNVQRREPEPIFEFVGGHLCLDFANTIRGLRGRPGEGVTNYPSLVSWSRQAGLISESEAQVLLSLAQRAETQAFAVSERAYALRKAIHGIFTAIAVGEQPTESDLEALNREGEQAMAGARLRMTADGFGWYWPKREGALDQMLGPLARSAAMLLTSAERTLVRRCANERCRWLFIDATKNHRRQWCTTTGCGNYVRVRRHRQRSKEKLA